MGWFKIGLFSLFLAYLLFSAITTAINERDVGIVISEIGKELYSPLDSLSEQSLKIVDDNKVENSFLDNLFMYWGFFFSLYKIYLWFWVLLKFIINPFLRDAIPLVIRLIFTIALFLIIQVMYFLYIGESPNQPLIAIWNFFKAIPFIFKI